VYTDQLATAVATAVAREELQSPLETKAERTWQ